MTYTFANMETAMFMAIGASDALNKLPPQERGILEDIGGRIGINTLIDYAEFADEVLNELSPDGSCPGVWCYEIAEEFGNWWVDNRAPSSLECRDHLRKTIKEWMK